MQYQSHDHATNRESQQRLNESAIIFRDTMAEAKIAQEQITDPQQQQAVYTEVTAIVQEAVEAMSKGPRADAPTAAEIRAEIERRNRRFPSVNTQDIDS